jgi:hypothetical protein
MGVIADYKSMILEELESLIKNTVFVTSKPNSEGIWYLSVGIPECIILLFCL